MAGHFDSVGLPVRDRDEFGQLITELATTAEREAATRGVRLLWSDRSGARVASFLNDAGSIECAKPSYAGTTTLRFANPREVADPGECAFCVLTLVDVLDEHDVVAYPLAVELDDPHLGPLGSDLGRVSVTAFAERMRTWPTLEAFDRDRDRPKFAERSLIPSGVFSTGTDPRPPRAEAIMTGIVGRCERKTNERSGVPFDWCELETYAATFDVVAPAQPAPFEEGQVVQGTFWLVTHRLR